MRAIHLVEADKRRPALLLTRQPTADRLETVVVALITSRVRDLPTEIPVGPANGIDRESVVNCDLVRHVRRADLGPRIGWFPDTREPELRRAIVAAFEQLEGR